MPGDLHERGIADDCARGLRVRVESIKQKYASL